MHDAKEYHCHVNMLTILHLCPQVRQLHREFLRAGSNVMQTFTFYASDDKLENRGNKLTFTVSLAVTPHTIRIVHLLKKKTIKTHLNYQPCVT